MSDAWVNLGVVLLFVLIGGFFSAAEIALVSLRESQVRQLAAQGRRGQRVSRLVSNPNRFLAAVQVGVTFAGFLSAGFGASRIAPSLTPVLERLGLPTQVAGTVAFLAVTVLIAYLSLVLGELVPKRLGLQRPETVALAVAGPVDLLARVTRPFIGLLSVSTDAVVRLIGLDPAASRERMSDEELRALVSAHEGLAPEERAIVQDVFEAGDRQLVEVMVPRTEVAFLDASLPIYKAVRVVADLPHSRYPVIRGDADDVEGFVHVRDLLDPLVASRTARVGDLARPVALLPETKRVLAALSEMRRSGHHLAIVVDEYGGTAGIVTLEDLVEEIVGDIKDEYDEEEATSRRLRSGALDVDGLLNLDDVRDETGLTLPEGPYETLAGFIVAALGRLPRVGDAVPVDGATLAVTEVDGRRVARVRVTYDAPSADASAAADDSSTRSESTA